MFDSEVRLRADAKVVPNFLSNQRLAVLIVVVLIKKRVSRFIPELFPISLDFYERMRFPRTRLRSAHAWNAPSVFIRNTNVRNLDLFWQQPSRATEKIMVKRLKNFSTLP